MAALASCRTPSLRISPSLRADRADRFPAVEKSREAFREWITIEAGHFHLIHTPDGVRKEAKSISWASMDDTAFEPLYRDVFAGLLAAGPFLSLRNRG